MTMTIMISPSSFSTRHSDDDDDGSFLPDTMMTMMMIFRLFHAILLHFPIFIQFFFTRYNDDVDDDDENELAKNLEKNCNFC